MRKLAVYVIACVMLAGCSAAPTFAPESVSSERTAEPSPTPEPKWLKFEGEWAGALGSGSGRAREYMALLKITGGEAFIALDKLEPFASGFGPGLGSRGMKLTVLDAADDFLTLRVTDYAYDSLDDSLGGNDTLRFDLDSSGTLRCKGLLDTSAQFFRVDEPNQDGPRWMKQFTDAVPGVRGVYEFGQSIGGEKAYVFVYDADDGFTRIRTGYGSITHTVEQDGKKAFISTYPMNDLMCDGEEAPYWDSAIVLDTQTGNFIDVTDEFTDYYKNEIIPRYEEALLLAMAESDAAPKGDEKNYLKQLVAVYTEALLMAHETAYGERPAELIIDVPDTKAEED